MRRARAAHHRALNLPVDGAAAFFERLDVVHSPRDLVALGGTLDPPTLVAAYRAGCFPWPPSGAYAGALERSARRLARTGKVPVLPGTDGLVPWCSPEPRAVLLPDRLVVSRALRRRLRSCGWTSSVDEAFEQVVAGCADRDETWINTRMRQGYAELHAAGVAHSLEVWDGSRLVGGLYGVLTGRVFSGESMFHRESDASKVALVDLVQRLQEGGVAIVDTQQETEHMASLGQVAVHREEYVRALRLLRDSPGALPAGRRPVARLASGQPGE